MHIDYELLVRAFELKVIESNRVWTYNLINVYL